MDQVTYAYTADDFVAFYLFATSGKLPEKRIPSLNTWLFVFSGAGIILAILAIGGRMGAGSSFQWIVYGVASLVFVIVWLKFCHKRVIAYQVRQAFAKGEYKGQTQEQSLSLSSEGIDMTSESGNSRYLWTAVESIEVSGEYLVARLRTNQVIFLPQRVFPDRNAMEAFAEKMRQYKQAAAPG